MQEITSLPKPSLSSEIKERLTRPTKQPRKVEQSTNPSIKPGQYRSQPKSLATEQNNGNGDRKASALRRYYSAAEDHGEWPPELSDYNQKFASMLEKIKRRHDPVVTTVAQGILEYKRKRQRMQIDNNIQAFLDRFYMSRIGIRMLIGQHLSLIHI